MSVEKYSVSLVKCYAYENCNIAHRVLESSDLVSNVEHLRREQIRKYDY